MTASSIDRNLLKTGRYAILIEDSRLYYYGTYSITLNKYPSTLRPGIYNANPTKGCNVSLNPTLSWEAVTGATGYDVYMAVAGAAALQCIATNIQTNSLQVTNCARGTLYDWKVVAHTPSGDIQGTVNWFMTLIPCDLNNDCSCDMRDWVLFGNNWGRTNCNTQLPACECDLNGDGRCNMQDWVLFGRNWGFRGCQ